MSSTTKRKVRVLIVDDSLLMQQLLSYIFNQDPEFQVVGTADDARSALEKVASLKPDVVTMDIQIKRSNGLEVTRQLMQTMPLPIVVISTSCQTGDTQVAMEVVQAGALAALPKPPSLNHPDFPRAAAGLRQMVKDMSCVKVVKRRPTAASTLTSLPLIPGSNSDPYEVVAIGASTGGPPAVLSLLKDLSPRLPVPVLLVQHIYPGFAPGLVQWLSSETDWQIKLVHASTKAESGVVYLCENGFQMGIRPDLTITVQSDRAQSRHAPSVSYLFAAVASAFGARAIGIILSGMGNDGAEELKMMRARGALTIAQDQKSSTVYGMPGEAAKIKAAEHVLSPTATARWLNQIFSVKQV
jgi:two-component system, chemotaxis family, protein-glutamate methylesterase/glutaminase